MAFATSDHTDSNENKLDPGLIKLGPFSYFPKTISMQTTLPVKIDTVCPVSLKKFVEDYSTKYVP